MRQTTLEKTTHPTKAEIATYAAGLKGWLKPVEGELLYDLASGLTGKGCIVEIGSYEGKSTVWLGHGLRLGRGIIIHSVDPHTGATTNRAVPTFEQFLRNLAAQGLTDLVAPHVTTSGALAPEFSEPVELLFIDGDHGYESAAQDFASWVPKVVNGGWVAMHDTTNRYGPSRIAEVMMHQSRCFRNVGRAASITFGQKTVRATDEGEIVGAATKAERLGNLLALMEKRIFETRYRLAKRRKR